MKTLLFDTTALTDFTPRNMCFAEADAADVGGGEPEAEIPSDDDILARLDEPEEGDGGEEQTEEFDEVDWDDGKKVKVTKGFKDALLREKDYRHKTHDLGQKERAIEAKERELAETFKMREALSDEAAELKGIEKRLAEYDKVTPEQWLAWRAEDEKATQDALFARDLLRQQKDKLVESMKEKYNTLSAKEKEKLSAWEAEQNKAIKEKVPDWTAEKAKTVAEHVNERFGLKIKAESLKDAGVIAMVNHIYTQDKAIEAAKAKAKAAMREREPEPTPVGKVNGGKAGAPRGPNAATLKANPAAYDAAISKMLYGGP